jgi:hypothetical protein
MCHMCDLYAYMLMLVYHIVRVYICLIYSRSCLAGTGFNGTVEGKLYKLNPAFHNKEKGWLCCVGANLYYRYIMNTYMYYVNMFYAYHRLK